MFITSVGVINKVHRCLMAANTEVCCETDTPECCQPVAAADTNPENDCCKDEIKSIALDETYVAKDTLISDWSSICTKIVVFTFRGQQGETISNPVFKLFLHKVGLLDCIQILRI